VNLFKKIISDVVWHEMGHFCLDVLLIKNNSNYEISSFKYEYNRKTNELTGCVTCGCEEIKSNKDLINKGNLNDLSFKILSVLAGSVFESIHNKKFCNNDLTPKEILSKGSAIYDAIEFNSIIKEFYNGADATKEEIIEEHLNSFLDIIFKNDIFVAELSKINQGYIEKIYNDLDQDNYLGQDNYSLNLSADIIKDLKVKVSEILNKSGMENQIEVIKDKIIKLLIANNVLQEQSGL